MFGLRKLLARDARRRLDAERDTALDSALPRGDGLEAEYETLIANQCQRWGIAEASFTVEVRQLGRGRDGMALYAGMLRLVRWERDSALRMLLGLPLLEAKIRRVVGGLWLCEVSRFGGLWLHASGQLQDTAAMKELRQAMLMLSPSPGSVPGDGAVEDPLATHGFQAWAAPGRDSEPAPPGTGQAPRAGPDDEPQRHR